MPHMYEVVLRSRSSLMLQFMWTLYFSWILGLILGLFLDSWVCLTILGSSGLDQEPHSKANNKVVGLFYA